MLPEIVQDLPIRAPLADVFDAVSRPAGLNEWWTKSSRGEPALDAEYELGFGAGYDWRAKVSAFDAGHAFELTMTQADPDWLHTRVGFTLERKDQLTWLRFHHAGWPSVNEHYRVSCHCWAMYLRVLRRFLDFGESVPYDQRLDI